MKPESLKSEETAAVVVPLLKQFGEANHCVKTELWQTAEAAVEPFLAFTD